MTGMVSKWIYTILGFLLYVSAMTKDEFDASIKWSALEYEDSCEKVAHAKWEFLKSPSEQTFNDWKVKQERYNHIKQNERSIIMENINGTNTKSFTTKIKLLESPGDGLLNDKDWNKLFHFVGTAELMRRKTEQSKNLSREEIEWFLSHSGKVEEKLDLWLSWHNYLAPLKNNFSEILLLVNKAATVNGEENAANYWEMLSEYSSGFANLNTYWEEISPLYKKFVNYIASRLTSKYEIPFNNTVSAYLLGTLQSIEWTSLASDVIPNIDRIFYLKENLWEKNLLGRHLYEMASKLGKLMIKQTSEADFWKSSEFNETCPSKLINFCREGRMRVFSCYEASLSNYIAAHKNMGKVLFNQLASKVENPILQISNRYSILEETFAEYFGIMSLSPSWLHSVGLIKEEDWELNNELKDELRLLSLMLSALDILPRIAYYVSTDLWRLEALKKNNIIDPEELTASWWMYRLEYQLVEFKSPEIPSFLDDDIITSNKPYLSKFIGTILAFQLYEQFSLNLDLKFNSIDANNQLAKIALNSTLDNWMDIIKKFTENDVDEINSYSLITFFSPLENYLDERESENVPIPMNRQREFEEKEKIYRKKAIIGTTTTTTTTTSTQRPITAGEKKKINQGVSKETAVPSTGATKAQVYNLEVSPVETSREEETKSTNKAVYVVGAVLIVTVLVCIITIFGRRRCVKAPKNRRYV